MEMTLPVTDAKQLYEQWQDGKLLDTEERKALRSAQMAEAAKGSFADALKSAAEIDA
jgi:hypothetical protein